jgi:hypothetical protein
MTFFDLASSRHEVGRARGPWSPSLRRARFVLEAVAVDRGHYTCSHSWLLITRPRLMFGLGIAKSCQ